jgi:hypothetical protein
VSDSTTTGTGGDARSSARGERAAVAEVDVEQIERARPRTKRTGRRAGGAFDRTAVITDTKLTVDAAAPGRSRPARAPSAG